MSSKDAFDLLVARYAIPAKIRSFSAISTSLASANGTDPNGTLPEPLTASAAVSGVKK
jgi:hypothetical protein